MSDTIENLKEAIDLIGQRIAAKNRRDEGKHRRPDVIRALMCGDVSCKRMILINDDGSQRRLNSRQVAPPLERVKVLVTPCDHHGGAEFPSTDAVDAALGHEAVAVQAAADRVIGAGFDTSSDPRSYIVIARSLNLIARTEVNHAALGLSEV